MRVRVKEKEKEEEKEEEKAKVKAVDGGQNTREGEGEEKGKTRQSLDIIDAHERVSVHQQMVRVYCVLHRVVHTYIDTYNIHRIYIHPVGSTS